MAPPMPMQGHGQNGVTWVGIGSPRAPQLPGPALACMRRAGRYRGEPGDEGFWVRRQCPYPCVRGYGMFWLVFVFPFLPCVRGSESLAPKAAELAMRLAALADASYGMG